MNKIAQFHKVSFEQFKESWDDSFPGASEEEIKEIYDQIKLPKRATRGSAGYDFFSPVDFELKPGETLSGELNCYSQFDHVEVYYEGRSEK